MPLRRKVETLKKLSSDVIMKNFLTFSTQDMENLPISVCEDLLQFIYNHTCVQSSAPALKIRNRNSMIKAHVKKLFIEFDPGFNTMSTVLRMSESLTYLKCTGKLTETDAINLVRRIPNIIVLNMKGEEIVNDNILEAIGDNCPNLQSLCLQSNKMITDDGIRRFCQSKSHGSNIKSLNFEYSFSGKITANGCLIALRNLKQLKNFKHKEVIEAFKIIFRDFVSNEANLPTFQLCQLPKVLASNLQYLPKKGFMNFLMKCCPNLTSLSLVSNDNFCFNELKNCDRLVPFTLWYNGQIPDLNEIGSKLTSLFLVFSSINLKSIGFGCPNLEYLGLSVVSYEPFNGNNNSQIPFRKLNDVEFKSEDSDPIPLPQLKFLLRNCIDLRQLTFEANNKITDGIIVNILHEVNPLKHLTFFCLYKCNRISKVLIMELLRLENDLNKLMIQDCKKFKVNDCKEIKSYIQENNYCVHFACLYNLESLL